MSRAESAKIKQATQMQIADARGAARILCDLLASTTSPETKSRVEVTISNHPRILQHTSGTLLTGYRLRESTWRAA